MTLYVLVLVGVGIFAFRGLPAGLVAGLGSLGAPDSVMLYVPAVISAIINIHHFYTDSCIWKISNPTVKKDLFSHLTAERA